MKSRVSKRVLEFLCESNFIEGICIDLEEYKNPETKKLSVINSIAAWEYLSTCSPFGRHDGLHNVLRNTHYLLMKDSAIHDKYKGAYRDCDVWIGGHKGIDPALIHCELTSLLGRCSEDHLSKKDIWEVHDRFEVIHPYIDGNGRMGRMLMNWLRVQHGYPIEIVRFTNRMEYYGKIEEYRKTKLIKEYISLGLLGEYNE